MGMSPEEALAQAEHWMDEGRLDEAVALLEEWARRLDHPEQEPYFDVAPDAARVHGLLRTIEALSARLEVDRLATMAELEAVRAQARFERSGEAEIMPWVFDRA